MKLNCKKNCRDKLYHSIAQNSLSLVPITWPISVCTADRWRWLRGNVAACALFCAAPSPAPWECAWTCKRDPGAPCIWPHYVPGSSLWWALRLRSAAGTDLEQCQNICVTTAATILTTTHGNPQCTQPSTQWRRSSKTKRKQPLCLLWEYICTPVFSADSLVLWKIECLVIWVCKRCRLECKN